MIWKTYISFSVLLVVSIIKVQAQEEDGINLISGEPCPDIQYACPPCESGETCIYPNENGCPNSGIPTCKANNCGRILCLTKRLPCPEECPDFCNYSGPSCCPFEGEPVCEPVCQTLLPCEVTPCPADCPGDCYYPNAPLCCPRSGQAVCNLPVETDTTSLVFGSVTDYDIYPTTPAIPCGNTFIPPFITDIASTHTRRRKDRNRSKPWESVETPSFEHVDCGYDHDGDDNEHACSCGSHGDGEDETYYDEHKEYDNYEYEHEHDKHEHDKHEHDKHEHDKHEHDKHGHSNQKHGHHHDQNDCTRNEGDCTRTETIVTPVTKTIVTTFLTPFTITTIPSVTSYPTIITVIEVKLGTKTETEVVVVTETVSGEIVCPTSVVPCPSACPNNCYYSANVPCPYAKNPVCAPTYSRNPFSSIFSNYFLTRSNTPFTTGSITVYPNPPPNTGSIMTTTTATATYDITTSTVTLTRAANPPVICPQIFVSCPEECPDTCLRHDVPCPYAVAGYCADPSLSSSTVPTTISSTTKNCPVASVVCPACPQGATCQIDYTTYNGCPLPSVFCNSITRTISPSLINSYPTSFDSLTTF
ncbi:hypothetical protein BD770DRAFT_430866 [Pilaira anomala]|nr:hypothetical protein BD770DRAFT_430866 [Pilaira anomala]